MSPQNVRSRRSGPPKRDALRSQSRIKSFLYVATFAAIISYGALYFFEDAIYSNVKNLLALTRSNPTVIASDADFIIRRPLEEAIKPFGGETSFNLDPVLGPNHSQPYWGTLNSGHYFSQRATVPKFLESGLIWFHNQLNEQYSLDLRFWCNQNDRLTSYAWHRHNFHDYGEQKIVDGNYTIETVWLKNLEDPQEWNAEITLTHSNNDSDHMPLSLIYYVTRGSEGDALAVESARAKLPEDQNSHSPVTMVEFRTRNDIFGQYRMSIDLLEGHSNFVYGNFLKANVTRSNQKLDQVIMQNLLMTKHEGKNLYIFPGNKDLSAYNSEWRRVENPNLVAYQLMLKAPAKFRVRMKPFSLLSTDNKFDFSMELDKRREEFENKFASTFPVPRGKSSEKLIELAQVSLSNMIGSIGYAYGHSQVSSDDSPHRKRPYGPIQLLSGVPSRPFFPRGFLWDDGFHNLIIGLWDSRLSVQIIKSWFNIMNIDGWIPREVILGDESVQRVPSEFLVQKISNANPPSMFLAIEAMVDREAISIEDLSELYPKLNAWFRWLNLTQAGLEQGTYRWRGRDELSASMLNAKTLTSGLDDYPRASHPSEHEYHLDLRCWMALASRTMQKIAKLIGRDSEMTIYSEQFEYLKNNKELERLHWSDEHQMFCDYGHNTRKVSMMKLTKKRKTPSGQIELYHENSRHVGENPKFGCVPELGYVSLFPLITQLLEPDNPKLGILLKQLADPETLWSQSGIRSLSKSSVYYNKFNTEHDPPYWRGAIWININYLILRSLNHYAIVDGPYREQSRKIYEDVRQNLISTVLNQYQETHYTWENYDDVTGRGKGSHPFTGWTSLILLIISNQL